MARRFLFVTLLIAISLGASTAAYAQYSGHNFKGDYGLLAASQPPPGWFVVPFYAGYAGDSLRDRDGNPIAIDPEQRGSIDVNAWGVTAWWVTEFKLFGGNYSVMVIPAWSNNTLGVPILDLREHSSTGFGDLYVQPINLGWHTPQADFSAGLGIYAPTGSWDPDADDNQGLGMWSFELFGGASIFFDEAKSWHFTAMAYYETHTEKQDTDIKVGDLLTVEGGFGKSFLQGALNVGVAYYGQWKLSDDDLGSGSGLPPDVRLGRNRVYGVGPELTIPIATKKKLIAQLTVRYLWESGARTTLEGKTAVVMATFPVPSPSL